MRSRAEAHVWRTVRVVALVVSTYAGTVAGTDVFAFTVEPQVSGTASAAVQTLEDAKEDANRTPTVSDVSHGVAALLTDPNLSGERTIKTLRWKDRTPRTPGLPGWLRWLGGLGSWVDQSARYVVWVAVGLGVLLLGVHLARLWNTRTTASAAEAFVAPPTHVGDLDIRPEALPSDIGAAARSLWDRGEHRAALALLYRGLLSRLVHVHRLPIRDSTTEGDCLRLTAERVPGARHDYATRLVRVWQHTVYGHTPASGSIVHRLCEEFAASMNRAPDALAPDAPEGPGTEGAQRVTA